MTQFKNNILAEKGFRGLEHEEQGFDMLIYGKNILGVLGPAGEREREFFIDNLLVRIHLIIEMILVDRPCAMGI